MAILLDHLIVPSHNPVASAQSLADILAVPWEAERGHFTPVYVNETLTLDFAEREQFDRHHYCFHVSEAEFDGIFARVRAAGIPYRSTPGGRRHAAQHPAGGAISTGTTATGTTGKC